MVGVAGGPGGGSARLITGLRAAERAVDGTGPLMVSLMLLTGS